jgi:hypothetical protein
MNKRFISLVVAVILMGSTITHTAGLKDYNPGGYIDDLSSLPGPEIYHRPSQGYSVGTIMKWVDGHQMLCAAGLTAAGFVLMYVVNPELRHKINGWLGFHAEQQDEIHS